MLEKPATLAIVFGIAYNLGSRCSLVNRTIVHETFSNILFEARKSLLVSYIAKYRRASRSFV